MRCPPPYDKSLYRITVFLLLKGSVWYKIGTMSHADPARSEPDTVTSTGADPILPEVEIVGSLRAEIESLRTIIIGLETLIGQLKKNNDELRALKFGKRSEKLTPGQLALGLEDIELTQAALQAQLERLEDEKQALSGKPRRRRDPNEARPSLPAHLPVVEEVLEPEHRECPCCHGTLHRIGETSADRLDIVPVQYFIRRTVRPKYACRTCEGQIVQAPAPAHVVEGGLPSEALVAQVLVAKHADHTPIYTQVQAMARQGIRINRNVVTSWAGRGAGELAPIWRRMREILLSGSHLFIDETEVRVLDPGRGRTKVNYFWAIARDGRPYGSQDPPIVIFTYGPGRGALHGRRMLEGFAGVVQCDGYSVYKTLAKERPDLHLAHCWAHCRREFVKLMKNDGSTPLAAEAVKRIRTFYAIEDEIKGAPAAARQAARQERTAPLMLEFREWLLETKAQIMKGAYLDEAIDYALGHWIGLTRFLGDGRVEIDSNTVERALRPVCLTRKNSLFAGNDEPASYCSSRHLPIKSADLVGISRAPAASCGARRRESARRLGRGRLYGSSMVRPCRLVSRAKRLSLLNAARLKG
jgi:transposase